MVRPVRAALLACVGVGLGAGGHAVVSGSVPPLPLLVLIALAVGAVACVGMAHELRARSILLGLAAAQGLTHGAGLLAHGGHLGSRPPAELLLCRLQGTAFEGTRSSLGIALMVLAHVVATLACVWWLRRGEAWVWSRLRAAARAARRLAGRIPQPRPSLALALLLAPAASVAAGLLPARSRPADGRGLSRRGPPAAVVVLPL